MILQILPIELIAIIISFDSFVLFHKFISINKMTRTTIDVEYNNYISHLMHTLVISFKILSIKCMNAKVLDSITTIKIRSFKLLQNIDLSLFKNLTSLIIELNDYITPTNETQNIDVSNDKQIEYKDINWKNIKALIDKIVKVTPIYNFTYKFLCGEDNINSTILQLKDNKYSYNICISQKIKNIAISGCKKLSINFTSNTEHQFDRVKLENIYLEDRQIINTKYIIFDRIEIRENINQYRKFIINKDKCRKKIKNIAVKVNFMNDDDIAFISNIEDDIEILKIIMINIYHKLKPEHFLHKLLNIISSRMKKIIIENHRFTEDIIYSFSEYTNVFF